MLEHIKKDAVIYHDGEKFKDVFIDIIKRFPEESFYFLDLKALQRRVVLMKDFFLPKNSNSEIAYAMKANPQKNVLDTVYQEGIHTFDCASIGEIRRIKTLEKVHGNTSIVYNNPIRKRKNIREALKLGVRHFTVDTKNEVKKILEECDNTNSLEIAVRLAITNNGAAINLSSKFGVGKKEVMEIIEYIKANTNTSIGLSTHVGSQNEDMKAYEKSIKHMVDIAKKTKTKLKSMNIGGGIPVWPEKNRKENEDWLINSLKSASSILERETKDIMEDSSRLIIEPGRSVAGPTVDLIVDIISVAQKTDTNNNLVTCVYMDDGVFTSFMDSALHRWKYPVKVISNNFEIIGGDKTT